LPLLLIQQEKDALPIHYGPYGYRFLFRSYDHALVDPDADRLPAYPGVAHAQELAIVPGYRPWRRNMLYPCNLTGRPGQ
jgi:hypothetical protein